MSPAVDRRAVEEAAVRILGRVRVTPTLDAGNGVTLKLECLQVTGSFKPRGSFNRLLSCDVGEAGIVVASGGNAGLAAAHAARELGHPAAVFVPQSAPPAKVRRVEALGASVHAVGSSYAEALMAAEAHTVQTGAVVVHAYDQPEVVAGAGTLAAELPEVDTVLVAVGGGGLIGGIAAWVGGRAKVVGVEPEGSPTLASAMEAGAPVDIDAQGIAADSLGARRIGALCWEQVEAGHVDRCLVLAGEELVAARHSLWDRFRVVSEVGGAAAWAALISGRYRPAPGERVAAIICGANTDPSDLA
jgi:threonine dehydratase